MKSFMLYIIAVFTTFIFACEDKLVSVEPANKSTKSEILNEEIQQEIEFTLERLKNAPSDFIEKYRNLQLNNPNMYYRPTIILITEHTPDFEKIKNAKPFGYGDPFTFYYDRKLSKEEIERYFSSKRHYNPIMENIEGYAYIRSAERTKYSEFRRKSNSNDANIYEKVDVSAQFEGGKSALSAYLKSNLKYPDLAKEKGIEDKLVMRFVVNTRGGLVYLNVDEEPSIKDEEISIEFQKEAFRVLQGTSGMWIPAEKDGKYVMSRMTLPIEFKLDK